MNSALLIDACGWALVHFLWQAAAVALALALFLRLVSDTRPGLRYGASCAALLVMVAALPTTLLWQAGRVSIPAKGGVPHASISMASKATDLPSQGSNGSRTLGATGDDMPQSPGGAASQSTDAWTYEVRSLISPWLMHIVAVWLVGVTGFSARLLLSWVAVKRLRAIGAELDHDAWNLALTRIRQRLAIARPVRLVQSTAATVPLVIGWMKPVVLVPVEVVTGLTSAEIEAVLAHELAHIRRHDYLVNLLQNVAETLLFYHPAVWWVSAQMRREREYCCDDIAAALDDGTAGYARALWKVESLKGIPSVLGVAANGGSLVDRIRRLSGNPPQRGLTGMGLIIATAILIPAAFVFAGWTATSAEQATVIHELGADDQKLVTIAGKVFDAADAPVKQATVLMSVYLDQRMQPFSTHTQDDGSFELKVPREAFHTRLDLLWTYATGHGLRVVNLDVLERKQHDMQDLVIRLPREEPTRYRVHGPTSVLREGVDVCPEWIKIPLRFFSEEHPTNAVIYLPDEIKKLVGARADKNGDVTLSAVQKHLVDRVSLTSPAIGIQTFDPAEDFLFIRPTIRIEGRISAADLKDLAGTPVYVLTSDHSMFTGRAVAELDEMGRFTIPAIRPGQMWLRIDWPDERSDLPFLADFQQLMTSIEQETLTLEIEARPAIKVTGKLLATDTRLPIEGALVYLIHEDCPNVPQSVTTGRDGAYELKSLAGKARLQLGSLGEESVARKYDFAVPQPFVIPAGVSEYSAEETLIQPRKKIAGKLIDSEGRPRGDVAIGVTSRYPYLWDETTTNDDGTFEVAVSKSFLDSHKKTWYRVAHPDSLMEVPKTTKLTVVSEQPLVLREDRIKGASE